MIAGIQLCKFGILSIHFVRSGPIEMVFVMPHQFPLLVALLLAYAVDVRRVDLVPGGHVLFHARSHALLLAARERCAGLGDALVEAVVLEFLVATPTLVSRE